VVGEEEAEEEEEQEELEGCSTKNPTKNQEIVHLSNERKKLRRYIKCFFNKIKDPCQTLEHAPMQAQ
jgi:hypothetical protein